MFVSKSEIKEILKRLDKIEKRLDRIEQQKLCENRWKNQQKEFIKNLHGHALHKSSFLSTYQC